MFFFLDYSAFPKFLHTNKSFVYYRNLEFRVNRKKKLQRGEKKSIEAISDFLSIRNWIDHWGNRISNWRKEKWFGEQRRESASSNFRRVKKFIKNKPKEREKIKKRMKTCQSRTKEEKRRPPSFVSFGDFLSHFFFFYFCFYF